MSYQDPYAHGQYGQQQYQDAPFNPYEVQHQHGYAEPTERYADGVYDYAGAAKEAPRSGFEDDVVPPPLVEKYVCSPLIYPTDNSCQFVVSGPLAMCGGGGKNTRATSGRRARDWAVSAGSSAAHS